MCVVERHRPNFRTYVESGLCRIASGLYICVDLRGDLRDNGSGDNGGGNNSKFRSGVTPLEFETGLNARFTDGVIGTGNCKGEPDICGGEFTWGGRGGGVVE